MENHKGIKRIVGNQTYSLYAMNIMYTTIIYRPTSRYVLTNRSGWSSGSEHYTFQYSQFLHGRPANSKSPDKIKTPILETILATLPHLGPMKLLFITTETYRDK